MTTLLSPLRLVVRATAVALLLIGIALWLGYAVPWRGVHLGLGVLLAAAVLALGAVVARTTGRLGALAAAVAWVALLVGYGIVHPRLWPGGAHWIAQLLHVLIGLATVGLTERLAAGARGVARPDAPPDARRRAA